MAEIEAMILKTIGWLRIHRSAKRYEEAWLCGTRLHALLDAYEAVGGNDHKWRNEAGILRNPL